MAELTVGLAQYLAFYNAKRPYQALGYETPDHVYRARVGRGAVIVDKFGERFTNAIHKLETRPRHTKFITRPGGLATYFPVGFELPFVRQIRTFHIMESR